MIISSFHTGPDRNKVIYILIMRRVIRAYLNRYYVYIGIPTSLHSIQDQEQAKSDLLFTYLSLFGTLFTSLVGLLLNREIDLIVHLFDIIYINIYIRHPPDNSNLSNQMSDSGLYDMTDQQKYFNTPLLSYIQYLTRQISYLWNTIHFEDALVVKWQTRETQNLVLKSVEVRVLFKA